jgi:KaiC/GvpD/RAD55 family RecA-like ATPase
MSKADNKAIVKKSQEILESIGVEVKTTQLYEFYSKLNDEPNWNIARAKGITFASVLTSNMPLTIPTGITALDTDLSGGLPRGQLTSIVGPVNSGKSMFAVSLGANAIRAGYKVLHVNLEGLEEETITRYTSNLSGVPLKDLMLKRLSFAQSSRLEAIGTELDLLRIENMLSFRVTVEDVIAKAREIGKTFKYDLLVIDYSQLLDSTTEPGHSEKTQAYVHRALAAFARETSVNDQGLVVLSPIQATRHVKNEELFSSPHEPISPLEIARVSGVILNFRQASFGAPNNKVHLFLAKQPGVIRGTFYGLTTNPDVSRMITSEFFEVSKKKAEQE